MNHHLFTLTADPTWLLCIDGFDPDREAQTEAVLALVNGYQGTRAALEEGHPASRPATLIAGIFNTPAAPQAPELEVPIPELVVAPAWSHVSITLDGAPLRLDQVTLLDQRRTLDLARGVLVREWRVRDAAGRITALRSLRFASLADRRALAQVLEITPENYSAALEITALVNGDVTNQHATRHLEAVHPDPAPGASLVLRTAQSGYVIACAAHAELFDQHGVACAGSDAATPLQISRSWRIDAVAGRRYTMQKIVAVATSRDEADPARAVTAHCEALSAQGLVALLAAHVAAWAARWNTIDIEVPGDTVLQREVRFALYHLIGAANPADERSSIGARALTGERYRGHVFWDTEIFVWPALLYTHPATARALLMYRYHTLDGARAKAAASGYAGALYPWEAADTGAEVTPDFMLSGGERVPVLTGREEHHIAADVAYAVLQYVQATGDNAFLHAYGAEIVLEVARFWASRAEADASGAYHIRRVIGPDEYHETVDDNAYINYLAAWVLRRAADLTHELAQTAPEAWQELAARLALDPAEPAHWRNVAGALVRSYDPATGLIEQFAGYYALEPIDLSDHDTSVATVDARLGWYAMQRTQVLKQADVIMLLILLWEDFSVRDHAANYAYYEPRTSHDSSLSPSFHALMAARLGLLADAEQYLRKATRIDLDLSRPGHAGASGGVHIAALGGVWQALALGFMGIQPTNEGLRIAPHIPPAWGELRLPFTWRGSRLRLRATPDGNVTVTLESGDPVQVAINGGPWRTVTGLRAEG
jgi:kojibiose phosphorylase